MTGGQILIVEDEWEVANFITEVLRGLGYGIVGPVARLDRGLHLATTAPIDAAILDINIRGGTSYPIAERLLARRVPFIFATGYTRLSLPEHFRGHGYIEKPFTAHQLDAMVRTLPPR